MKIRCSLGKVQVGFSLIETLISIVLFGLGMLGISALTATGLKTMANTNARGSALMVASQTAEPILSARTEAAVKAALTGFPKIASSDHNKDNYSIDLIAGVDGDGTSIVSAVNTTTAATWTSPVTIVLRVPYKTFDGSTVNSTPSFSFYF